MYWQVRYGTEEMSGYNALQILFTKSKDYEWENEVRAVVCSYDPVGGQARNYRETSFPHREPQDDRRDSLPRRSYARLVLLLSPTCERRWLSADRHVFASMCRNEQKALEWQLFDRPAARTHSRGVRLVLRQVASVVCMVAFAQSAVALCAGRQATPEARMQCCQDGACPLHRHDDGVARTQITQAAADDCCALSPSPESTPSTTAFAATITFAVLQSHPPVVMSLVPAPLLSAPWETPSPPTHVPKHLLLSVLLV